MTNPKSFPADFPITKRWAPINPENIQLYSFPTPNGVKVSIAMEEMGLAYDAHKVSIMDNDQMSEPFLSLAPNNKIPAIIDPKGPEGTPVAIFESGAILIYLADKTGQLLPASGQARFETLQWLMWQMGGLGPMFGQIGFFYKFAGKDIEDKRPLNRYVDEGRRLLTVLEAQLEGQDWVTGTYSIADIAIAPWLFAVREFYGAGEILEWENRPNVNAYLERFMARDAVQRGRVQPPRD